MSIVKSIAADFGGVFPNTKTLTTTINEEGGITPYLDGILTRGDVITFLFVSALSAGEITTFENILAAHDPSPSVNETYDLEGKRLVNVGVPVSSTDGVTQGILANLIAPIVSSYTPKNLPINATTTITIKGYNFTVGTTVEVNGQTTELTEFVDPNNLKANITTGAVVGTYNMTISNEVNTNTIESGITLIDTGGWIDLRLGGTTLNVGTDVRFRSGMSMGRDSSGMYFTGQNPWKSWVKFEYSQWTRGENRNISWVITRPQKSMMVGIGSTATNESSNKQYAQAEVVAYFSSGTYFWGLFGNEGEVGDSGSISSGLPLNGSGVYKLVFMNDGAEGEAFLLYELPSTDQSDWDDESKLIKTIKIGDDIEPEQTELMPFIIPRNGDTQRFIAYKVE